MLARYYSNSLDRFLSPDPSRLGVHRLNPQTWNGYTYALNDPLNNIDPTGLYQENFHYAWIYMLAKQAGFSEAEARAIAKANNDMDRGKTRPTKFLFGSDERRNFHGFGANRGAAQAAAEGAGSLVSLGQSLHHFQDTFSHEGFGAVRGHLFAGHGPDISATT